MARKMNGTQTNTRPKSVQYNNKILYNNSEIAEALADAFCKVSSTENYSAEFRLHKAAVEKDFNKYLDHTTPDVDRELNFPFSLFELENAIAATKRIIIPLLKQGKSPNELASYRPIALTSAACKVMERMVTSRLVWYLEKQKILNKCQSGFRKHRCTVDHIIRLQDTINKYIHNKGHTLGVFLDFEKAYDMMWRDGLFIKLYNLGIRGNMFNFIKDFLNDRTMQVRVGDVLSSIKIIENGTAQGSVIFTHIIPVNDK